MGIGSIALAWLLNQEQAHAKPKSVTAKPFNDLKPRLPTFEPKAKAMISLFQHGGPSHMDLTDPKPELTKYSGTDYTGDIHFSFVNEASKKLLAVHFVSHRVASAVRNCRNCCRIHRRLSMICA